MDALDLNLDNYDLDDILNLFKVDISLTDKALREARNTALLTHPDRSRLPKEFFLFFMKAYKVLEQVHSYRSRKAKTRSTDYVAEVDRDNARHLHALDGKSVKEFNAWFNDMFERVRIGDDDADTGYADWLKSEEGLEDTKNVKLQDFGREFARRKRECRALIPAAEVMEVTSGAGYSLDRQPVADYSSDIFRKLKYDDVRKAHTQTVVPVTEDDLHARPRFQSADGLRAYRAQQDVCPISVEQSREYLAERSRNEDELSARRAYAIMRREEQIERGNERWWSQLKQITDE